MNIIPSVVALSPGPGQPGGIPPQWSRAVAAADALNLTYRLAPNDDFEVYIGGFSITYHNKPERMHVMLSASVPERWQLSWRIVDQVSQYDPEKPVAALLTYLASLDRNHDPIPDEGVDLMMRFLKQL